MTKRKYPRPDGKQRLRKMGIVNWRQVALNSEQLKTLILLGQWCHRTEEEDVWLEERGVVGTRNESGGGQ